MGKIIPFGELRTLDEATRRADRLDYCGVSSQTMIRNAVTFYRSNNCTPAYAAEVCVPEKDRTIGEVAG